MAEDLTLEEKDIPQEPEVLDPIALEEKDITYGVIEIRRQFRMRLEVPQAVYEPDRRFKALLGRIAWLVEQELEHHAREGVQDPA